jgi:flagellar biosynthetic protein FliQ
MDAPEVVQICRDAIYTLIIIAAPLMCIALVVGLVIALIQALTQIQEQTLSFVPKVLAMLLMLGFTMPFMLQHLIDLNTRLQDKIVHIQ